MRIDIISDTICPWCFIGKRRLARALALCPQDDVAIAWHPFQLNPDMPKEGVDRRQYLAAKFGGPERAERIYDRIRDAGHQEGIDFRFELIQRTPNTVESHRLVSYAGARGVQDAVVEALFQAYFVEGRDVGDATVLADIAAATGLERADVAAFLASRDGTEEVLAEDEKARSMGITGVPCFIIDRRYAISGAQSPEVFFQVFDLVRAERTRETNPADTAG